MSKLKDEFAQEYSKVASYVGLKDRKECPVCGTMINRLSYDSHIRAHARDDDWEAMIGGVE